MKKTLFLVAVMAFFMLSTIVAPTIAKPAKMVPVTLVRQGVYWSLGTDFWTTKGGIYQSRGSEFGFTTFQIIFDETTLSGSSHAMALQNLDTNTGRGNLHLQSVLKFPEGTFEGEVIYKGTFALVQSGPMAGYIQPVDILAHAVYHGTGTYHGWTFVIDTGTNIIGSYYLLIP